jgi:hypothetical protein
MPDNTTGCIPQTRLSPYALIAPQREKRRQALQYAQ